MPSLNCKFLKSARVLANVKLCGPSLQAWWTKFEKAQNLYDQHGSIEGLLTANRLSNWLQTSRDHWREGKLSYDQIIALQSINVRLNSPNRGGPNITGTKMSRTLHLLDRKKDDSEPLTLDEQKELRNLLSYYRAQLSEGRLKDDKAAKLGLV